MEKAPYNWRELQPDEIMLKLNELSGAGETAQTSFLDIHQWTILQNSSLISVGGGHGNAYYRKAWKGGEAPDFCFMQIHTLNLPENARSARGVRTYLARHLDPEFIGDIVVGETVSLVTSIRGKAMLADLGATEVGLWNPEPAQEKKITASANRLDAIVSAIGHVSRGEAQTAIEYGFLFVDFRQVTKRTAAIRPNSHLAFRNHGRYEITGLQENPGSQRLWVTYRAYPV